MIGLGAIVLYINVIILVIPAKDANLAAVICNVCNQRTLTPTYTSCFNLQGQSLANISRVFSLLWDYHN